MSGYETLFSTLNNDGTLTSLAIGGIFISFPESFNTLPVVSFSEVSGNPLISFGGLEKMNYFTVDVWSLSDQKNIDIGSRIDVLLSPKFIKGIEMNSIEDKVHHKSMKFNILN